MGGWCWLAVESLIYGQLKSHLLCFWFNTRMGDRMSLRCRLFVSEANQGNYDFWCKKVDSRFFFVAPRMERFSLNFVRAVEKNMTWKWRCGGWAKFVVAG